MWHGPARFPKALKQAGWEVAAVCGRGEWVSYTRYVDRFFYVTHWEPRPLLEYLVFAIEEWQPDLILPATDNMVAAVQELRNLADRGMTELSEPMIEVLRNSTFNPETAHLLDSKYDLLEALKERGVRIPPQRELVTMGDADAFVQEHGYPVLLKPDVGFAGIGIKFCYDEEELIQNLNEVLFAKKRERYAIQKYLGNKTALIEFIAKDGKVVAHNCAQRIKTHPGETGPVTVLRVVQSLQMLEAAQAMADLLGYNGIGVPQFAVEDDSCQEVYLLELNPRMSHFPHIWRLLGTDFARGLKEAWSGKRVTIDPPRVGVTIALWPQEAIRDPHSEYLHGIRDKVEDDPDLLAAYEKAIAER